MVLSRLLAFNIFYFLVRSHQGYPHSLYFKFIISKIFYLIIKILFSILISLSLKSTLLIPSKTTDKWDTPSQPAPSASPQCVGAGAQYARWVGPTDRGARLPRLE